MSLPLFIEGLVKDKNVASIMPTRRSCVKRFLRDIPNSRDGIIVEYGPGSGAFTAELLSHLGPKSFVYAFETNKIMVSHLNRNYSDWRLKVFHCQAQNAMETLKKEGVNEGQVEMVLSGIPLSFLSQATRRELFESTSRLLRPQGVFLIYQLAWTPYKSDSQIIRDLREFFDLRHKEFFWLNVPPLIALRACPRK